MISAKNWRVCFFVFFVGRFFRWLRRLLRLLYGAQRICWKSTRLLKPRPFSSLRGTSSTGQSCQAKTTKKTHTNTEESPPEALAANVQRLTAVAPGHQGFVFLESHINILLNISQCQAGTSFRWNDCRLSACHQLLCSACD